MTDEEIIRVVSAHKEGKKIQFRTGALNWIDCANNEPAWDFTTVEYRVAPDKPREWLLCDGTSHEQWVVVNNNHLHLDACKGERVLVREVLE